MIILGKGIELIENEILRLEIELIELGRLEDTKRLEYNSSRDLVVKYEPTIGLMDPQSQAQSHEQSNT